MSSIARFGRNLQFSFYLKVATILGQLLLVPFILERVDASLYGLNVLLVSITGYFFYLDFGMNAGISRYTSKYRGEGRNQDLNELVNIGNRVFLAIAILSFLVLFFLSFSFERLFRIDDNLIQHGRTLFQIYAAASFFLIFNTTFKGVLFGLQREDIPHKANLVVSILNFPLAISVLYLYNSYLLYIFLLQLFTVATTFYNIHYVFKLLPFIKIKWRRLSKSVFQEIFSFSGYYFLAGICGLIIFQVDNLVIGSFLSLGSITMYSIAFSIHQQVRSFNGLLGSPIYHILATEFAKPDQTDVISKVTTLARMHIGILIPLLVIIVINMDLFIIAWVGGKFSNAIMPARILVSYFFVNIVTEVLADAVVGGVGKVAILVKINACVAVSNLVLSLLLVKQFGISGVALGTAIPWIVFGIGYLFIFCRLLSLPAGSFLTKSIIPNLPHVVFSAILALAIHEFVFRPNLIEILICMGFCYLTSMVCWYLRLDRQYKRVIAQVLKLRT